ncbi:stage VI sporulation protein D [Bacillus sp. FJAT-49736]|uniref:stage VI sporulation protein D n=1 Tax=Bacillus sp. FJAT-49736 TaxID=2833582 RepID=UPI001BCA333A|nr:stage VI sporulation protein D [Bacillus sp. FJAT-49736]MBS4173723.1 stage VI sporulation protein D [Bacillus sp. FJAT-49736]
MSENQSSLRFSLEESVWFKRGQEVEELLSISLDPHITIQEQEQYVVIQGKLFLSGEYRNNAEEVEEQETSWQKKYVQTVDYREEEGVYQFEHPFPVDITIPKDKVEDLSYLDVSVDSFDYDIYEDNCLKLNADLTISGLRKEEENITAGIPQDNEKEEIEYEAALFRAGEQEEEEEELVPIHNFSTNDIKNDDNVEEDLFQPFNVEVRKIPDENATDAYNQRPFEVHEPHLQNNPYNLYQHSYPSQEESFDRKKKKAKQEEDESSSFTEVELHQDDESLNVTIEEYQMEEQVELVEVEEMEVQKKKKKKEKYESISLSDFLARKQEEKAAKLRMCIVQSGETIDFLAEKYDISVQQILRMNHLESNQSVSEGQVLYIPSYAGKK